jgi:hypothetical protein
VARCLWCAPPQMGWDALRAMHGPAGAIVAGSDLTAFAGARRSGARSPRSPVALPFTPSSTTTQGRHRRRCALSVRLILSPPFSGEGALRIAYAPEGQQLRHPCLCLKADRRRAPWASSQHGHRPATVSWVARPALTPLWLSSLLEKASQGTAAGLLRQGQALHWALAGDAWDCGMGIPLTSG